MGVLAQDRWISEPTLSTCKSYYFPWNCKKTNFRTNFATKIGAANMFAIKNKAQSKSGEFPVMGGIQSETRHPLTGDGGGGPPVT